MIGQEINGRRVWGEAGKFRVYSDGSFDGPADYIRQVNVKQVMSDAQCLAGVAPNGCTVYQLIAVALQTNYAGWLGARQLNR